MWALETKNVGTGGQNVGDGGQNVGTEGQNGHLICILGCIRTYKVIKPKFTAFIINLERKYTSDRKLII